MIRATGGGTFDPNDKYVYFIAGSTNMIQHGARSHSHLLQAVNELESEQNKALLSRWLDEGKRVFLDSGVYTLAMDHARAHGMTHNEALNLAPEEVDGFEKLFDDYCELVSRFGDRLWGYVEIDFGGKENKRRTRGKLESLGFSPIPVYHPFGDGWDYFDELAQNYDRICFGNVVQADRATRLRLVATAWERKQAYPHLWIHLLGLTPNEWLDAYPIDSGDSSSWLAAIRWAGGYYESVAGKTIGPVPRGYRYELGSEASGPTGLQKATQMAAYGSNLAMRNWRRVMSDYAEVTE